MKDYFGEKGCCLTCPDQKPKCLCYDCRCIKCEWYEFFECVRKGKCSYPLRNDLYLCFYNRRFEECLEGGTLCGHCPYTL